MDPVVTFILLLIFLFFLSKSLTTSIGKLLYALTKSKKITIGSIAVLFLPGTTIHEFAHASAAQMMGVPVGEIDLMPQVLERHIKLGSVQIAESDPIRRFLIGTAPLLVGLILLAVTVAIYSKLELTGLWPTVILFYVIFQIGNTMFSSERDMEGAIELIIAVDLVLTILYFAGLKSIFSQIYISLQNLDPFFKMASGILVKIIALDIALILLARAFHRPIK